jgi:SAM-dependent methyltransferase
MSNDPYVHGYSGREGERLHDQATTLAEVLHHDTLFSPGARVIEVGCGVGAQTVLVAPRNPSARIVSIELVRDSLEQARRLALERGIANVAFVNADVFRLPFPDASLDHAFVCFVLEHLPRPLEALAHVRRVLKPGGHLTVIEGDHRSAYFHPWSDDAWRTIACLIEAQARAGGDAQIGRRLFPLLSEAGFTGISVTPRVVYADASRPQWVDGFTRKTFIAMVAGARQRALDLGLIDSPAWDKGIAALERAADQDGTFNYTFFKAQATKGPEAPSD